MVVNGWTLLFHDAIIAQLGNLAEAAERARRVDPQGDRGNANVKLLAALAKLMFEVIPADPARPEYRLGNTLGTAYRHWFRAKFFNRLRLFFRYDSRARIIVYAWVNDERTLRQRGGRNDPYAVFGRTLASGNPPNDWAALVRGADELPAEILSTAQRDARNRRNDTK